MTTLKSYTQSSAYTVRLICKEGQYGVVQLLSSKHDFTWFDTKDEAEALFEVLSNVGYF